MKVNVKRIISLVLVFAMILTWTMNTDGLLHMHF